MMIILNSYVLPDRNRHTQISIKEPNQLVVRNKNRCSKPRVFSLFYGYQMRDNNQHNMFVVYKCIIQVNRMDWIRNKNRNRASKFRRINICSAFSRVCLPMKRFSVFTGLQRRRG